MNQFLLSLYVAGMNLFNGIAYDNGLGNATTMIEGLAATMKTYVTPVATVALVICGLWWIIGGKKSSDEAKSWLKRIAVGIAIAYAATAIVNWIESLASQI